MIKNIRLAVFGATLSILASACTDDTFSGTSPVRMEGKASIPLVVTIPDAQIVQTRTGGSGDASIEKLNVLLFDNSAGDTNEGGVKLVAHRSVDGTAATVELPLSSGSSRLVYVVANAGKYLSTLPVSDTDLKETGGGYKYSLTDIRSMLTTASVSPDDKGFVTGDALPGIPVPMSGVVRFDSGLTSADAISVQLVRLLSKISVSTPLPASKFKIKGLTICNGAQTGNILMPASAADDGKGSGRMGYSVVDSLLYAYPTLVGGAGNQPVSVVVEAEYDGRAESSFYRLLISTDLSSPDNGLSLQRNHHYLIKINKVNINGYKNLDTAIASPPSNVDYNVTELNNYSNVTLIGGNFFSLDYERFIIYADSLEQLSTATMRTNYPLTTTPQGSVTVDDGLVLLGTDVFVGQDTVKTFNVKITSSYSHLEHSDSNPKGIHISLGSYHKTIEIIKRPSADIHPQSLEISDITDIKFISSSGDISPWWVNFSTEAVYTPFDIHTVIGKDLLSGSGFKAYVHIDENMNADYREVYFQTVSKTGGVPEKYILRQEGIKKYTLGFFGGAMQTGSNILQFSHQLVIEGYEENKEPLSLFPQDKYPATDTEKSALNAVFESGKKSTILLANTYNSPAALYCLNKNRDQNGNGKIDDDEVLWYLPGIRQGMGIMFYQVLTENLGSSYWSSSCCFNTFEDMYGKPVTTQGAYMMNTINYSGGYRFFCASFSDAATMKNSIRCVRDL